ncbi:MAG: FAD-dependent oxidoreductase [Pseudonocardiales bacterium]|nr:FAD-dependent oxidoreductase [Pseudonocardiales bacterium]
MRAYVEANQETGRMHVQMLAVPDPEAEPGPEPDMDALTALTTAPSTVPSSLTTKAGPTPGRRLARQPPAEPRGLSHCGDTDALGSGDRRLFHRPGHSPGDERDRARQVAHPN